MELRKDGITVGRQQIWAGPSPGPYLLTSNNNSHEVKGSLTAESTEFGPSPVIVMALREGVELTTVSW